MDKQETNNKRVKAIERSIALKPIGKKKTGKLKSIFADGTKIYITKDDAKTLMTEEKCTNLFYFMYNNWESIMEKYFEANTGQKTFTKTVNFYISNCEYNKLKKGIRLDIKNTIFLKLEGNQPLLKIMNEIKLKEDKDKDKKNENK